jgi:hypothetical protein
MRNNIAGRSVRITENNRPRENEIWANAPSLFCQVGLTRISISQPKVKQTFAAIPYAIIPRMATIGGFGKPSGSPKVFDAIVDTAAITAHVTMPVIPIIILNPNSEVKKTSF